MIMGESRMGGSVVKRYEGGKVGYSAYLMAKQAVAAPVLHVLLVHEHRNT